MARESSLGRVTGTWGGILSGVAAIITAVALSVTDTADEQAQKADQKSEMVLDLIRDQFQTAAKDRERLGRELEYQRAINAKLFSMIGGLRREFAAAARIELDEPEPSWTAPVRPSSGAARGAAGYAIVEDPLAAAIEDLPEEDRFDLPEPPPAAPVQQKALDLPNDLEDLIKKK